MTITTTKHSSSIVRNSSRLKAVSALFLMMIQLIASPVAATETDPLLQLKSMSLENLMQVTVFSASMKQEKLSNVSAAMHVITHLDIVRSGARTLPDLLRGVPGLHVANIDAHTWSVASRGMGNLFSNKLLVLMDGRTLYTPLYSGVYWDMQGTLLEDIERIEIIRGPGATIWGANAVNGVINIITRKAVDTTGVYTSAGGGDSDKINLNVRAGHTTGDLSYRVYATHLNRNNFEMAQGSGEHPDNWQNDRAGFRLDWEIDQQQDINILGDIYKGTTEQLVDIGNADTYHSDVDLAGGNIQLKWNNQLSSNSAWQVQTYLDRYLRDDGLLKQSRTTWDISFNHRFPIFDHQDFIWGGGYRYTTDRTKSGIATYLDPANKSLEVLNLFAQNDIAFIDDTLHFILGSKFEHNDYTSFEIQPTARVLWTPNNKSSFWGAVSRAVRTPSRADTNIQGTILEGDTAVMVDTPFGPTTVPAHFQVNLEGNPQFKTEELIAYELGYRTQPLPEVSFDIALFYNDYKNLRTQEVGAPIIDNSTLPVQITAPATIANSMVGEAYGAELSSIWQVTQNLRLSGSYSWYKLTVHHSNQDADMGGTDIETETPEHQASLKSYLDLPYDLQWDTSLYYFSNMYMTPKHLRCDMRVAWQPTEAMEISFKVENLFDDEHKEYFDNLGLAVSAVPRNWYAELKYRF